MKTRFSLVFLLRKSRGLPNHAVPIYLRVTIGDERVELSTKKYVPPERWNSDAQKVTGTGEEARTINAYLKLQEQEVFAAHQELIRENKNITAANLKNKLLGLDTDRRYIIELFKEHNKKMEALIGKEFAQGTMDRYAISLKHTQAFIEWKYKVTDLDISRLNYEFIENYEFWLKSVRNCDHNTTMKYLGNFKKIVLHCVKNEWLLRDPFVGFKLSTREVKRTALTEEEITLMAEKTFEIERIARVRDIFLFSCFTGLAYADVRKLKKSEIAKGFNGKDWIFTSRKKTDTSSRIPLLPEAIAILNKYEDHPQCCNQDRAFPVMSNQKMNAYLKEIADLCGIQKNLTYHLARYPNKNNIQTFTHKYLTICILPVKRFG
jgi:site-specific recombinase XerD